MKFAIKEGYYYKDLFFYEMFYVEFLFDYHSSNLCIINKKKSVIFRY